MLCLLGAFAVGVTTSGTASAFIAAHLRGCTTTNTIRQNERFASRENCEKQAPEEPAGLVEHKYAVGPIRGTSGVSKLASTILKKAITIVCKKDKFSGELEEEGKSKATITYEECSLEGLSGCRVPNITANVLDRLVESEKVTADEFFEKEGKGFTTVVIEVCTLKGSYKVTGSQICKLPKGEEFASKHEIECTTGGSSLKLGTEPATYEGTATVELESKEEWEDE